MEFARKLWGDQAYHHLYYSVFYKSSGKPYNDATDLTELLETYFDEYLEVKIGVQQYRTLAAAVSRRLGIEHMLDNPDDITEGLQDQMGHSQPIADLYYGLEPGDTAGNNARTRAVHENASHIWHHKFLGLRNMRPIKEMVSLALEERVERVEEKLDRILGMLQNLTAVQANGANLQGQEYVGEVTGMMQGLTITHSAPLVKDNLQL